MGEPLVPRDDARAALEARRELGPAYEEELAERFAERIESQLKQRTPARASEQNAAITIVSLIAAIPMIAIAGNYGQGVGVAVVCLALVLVNYFARR